MLSDFPGSHGFLLNYPIFYLNVRIWLFGAGVRRWLLLFTACYDQVDKINLRTELSELKTEGHCKIMRILPIKGFSFFCKFSSM